MSDEIMKYVTDIVNSIDFENQYQERIDALLKRPVKFRALWQHDETGRFCFTYYDTSIPIIPLRRYHLVKKDMQFTGFIDKNGKDVYELDILRFPPEAIKVFDLDRAYVLVGYKEGAFMYGRSIDPFVMNTYLWIGTNYSKNFEVVSNLYENPELLQCDLSQLGTNYEH
jgi:hypothetical protein